MNAMRHFTKLFVFAALSVAAASCGDVSTSSRAPVFLVLESVAGIAGGANDGKPASTLFSDVQSLDTKPDPCSVTTPCPTVYSDSGEATFHLSEKDITSISGPTSNNQVTINRYHVAYRRADGRNVPGVDVPYPFDGAITITVPPTGKATTGFELVRHAAKIESPLVQLITNRTFITTLAEVTFYGQDVVGNEIQAVGSIQVDFGNFADR
jgi:hypothetical protein